MGSKGIPFMPQLTGSALNLLASGQQLMQPLLTGAPLPTGAEATVQGSAQASKAAILSNAAATGQLGSSSTQQALQQADIAAQQQRYTIASNMYTEGVKDVGLGNSVFEKIGEMQLAQDKEMQQAFMGVAQMFAPTQKTAKDATASTGPSMFSELDSLLSGLFS